MNTKQAEKQNSKKVTVKKTDNVKSGKKDMIWFILSAVAIVACLIFIPKFLAMTGVSFLSAESGLNKLLSVLISLGAGYLALLPSVSFKKAIELSAGARMEWKKTVKPGKDEVIKTTIMVLAIVSVVGIAIYALDFGLFKIYQAFLG